MPSDPSESPDQSASVIGCATRPVFIVATGLRFATRPWEIGSSEFGFLAIEIGNTKVIRAQIRIFLIFEIAAEAIKSGTRRITAR